MSVQLHKAIDILELIEASERPLALGAIADRVAMGKPAAHRLLQVLVARGYVEQDPETQNYLATLRMAIIGFGHLAATGMREVTYPELHRLAAESGELVRLAVIENDEMTWIVEAQGARAGLRYDGNLGRQAVLHATAAGKSWLSTHDGRRSRAAGAGARLPVERRGRPQCGDNDRGSGRVAPPLPRGAAMLPPSRKPRSASTPSRCRSSTPTSRRRSVASIIVVGPSARMTPARMEAIVPMLHCLRGADQQPLADPPPCPAARRGAGIVMGFPLKTGSGALLIWNDIAPGAEGDVSGLARRGAYSGTGRRSRFPARQAAVFCRCQAALADLLRGGSRIGVFKPGLSRPARFADTPNRCDPAEFPRDAAHGRQRDRGGG